MNVVVTGSAGFVGKHLVAALRKRRDTVIALDRSTGDLSEGVPHIDADIDAVVHLASSCSTAASIRDPLTTFRDTVATAANVLEAFRGIPTIVTSSVKARDGKTPYGAAKRMVETWATEYAAMGTPIVINRPGTIYGPGQEGSADSGWIAWFLRARAERRSVTVHGDGEQVRDLLHVSDYVRLLLLQLDDSERYAGTWDVGGGQFNAVTVHGMIKHLGLKHTHTEPRYGDAPSYVGENLVPGWLPLVDWRTSETLA